MRLSNLRYYRRSLISLSVGILLFSLLFSFLHHPKPITTATAPPDITEQSLSLPAENTENNSSSVQSIAQNEATSSPIHWQIHTLKAGDSLATVLHHYKIPAITVQKLLKNKLAKPYLNHLTEGHLLQLSIENHRLTRLNYSIDLTKTLQITLNQDSIDSQIITKAFSESLLNRSFSIHHDLLKDAKAAGLTTSMTYELEKIFSNQINFNRSLHLGDHFKIIYQEYSLDGKPIKPGNIVAAKIQTSSKTYFAFRYTSANGTTGYYDEKGEGLAPMLLRAPVHYSRISSIFTLHRWQPLLHIWRPHLGVDYAAPIGTPIHAAGNGIVDFVGAQHGYGNVVMINHPNHYVTLYAHMSRFAANLHAGEKVSKGQTIGFIGMSGLATGPHVHYEIHHLSLRLNPLKATLPGDNPLSWSSRSAFKKQAKTLMDQLQ